jgi:enamine deaminase RidA (YjgF/YER057c/UK114 family)
MAAIAELGRGPVAPQAGAGQTDAQVAAISGSVGSLPEAHDLFSPVRQQGRVILAHLLSRFQACGLGARRSWRFLDPAS